MPLTHTVYRTDRTRISRGRSDRSRAGCSHPGCSHALRERSGRALIELIVSALLLSVAATATLSLLQLTLSASVRISDLTAARDLARDLAEQTVATPCAAGAGATSRPRIAAQWSASTVQQSVHMALTINFVPRPGAVSPPRMLDAVLAGWCT